MLLELILVGSFWYVAFAVPYALICWAGKGRVINGLYIAALPSLISAFEWISEMHPSVQAFQEKYAGPLLACMFGLILITLAALHIQWQDKLPRPGPKSLKDESSMKEVAHSIVCLLCALPIFGIFAAYPLAIVLTARKVWKIRKNSPPA